MPGDRALHTDRVEHRRQRIAQLQGAARLRILAAGDETVIECHAHRDSLPEKNATLSMRF